MGDSYGRGISVARSPGHAPSLVRQFLPVSITPCIYYSPQLPVLLPVSITPCIYYSPHHPVLLPVSITPRISPYYSSYFPVLLPVSITPRIYYSPYLLLPVSITPHISLDRLEARGPKPSKTKASRKPYTLIPNPPTTGGRVVLGACERHQKPKAYTLHPEPYTSILGDICL